MRKVLRAKNKNLPGGMLRFGRLCDTKFPMVAVGQREYWKGGQFVAGSLVTI